MSLHSRRPWYILVGPEDKPQLCESESGRAPRLDYRLVAGLVGGSIIECFPPPSMLRGGKVTRSSRSLGRNLGSSIQLVRRIHDESAVYSTGETWGLPMALTGALLPRRRFTHVVYVHRVFSSAWLGFLHATRHLLAVDGWICVTQHQAELLRNTFGEGGKPVAVVSQGVDTAFFDSNKASPAQGRPYLLAVGVEMRNYGLLFDAVRDLDIDVVVKASSAWMAASRSEITSVPANVALITRRLSHIELRDLYAGAALVVVPLYDTSQAAGITAILEGMAMQKCVVATRSRGLPDILVQNQTGVICEPSAGVLADNLAQLLAAPEQREALGNCGRNAVIAKASVEQYAKQITDFVISVSDGQAT